MGLEAHARLTQLRVGITTRGNVVVKSARREGGRGKKKSQASYH